MLITTFLNLKKRVTEMVSKWVTYAGAVIGWIIASVAAVYIDDKDFWVAMESMLDAVFFGAILTFLIKQGE